MSNKLPADTNPPAEEPPPYSEIAEGGNVSIDEGAGVSNIRRWDVQTNRPSQSTATTGSSASTQHSRPPMPVPSIEHHPPPGPPPGHRPPPPTHPPTRPPRPANEKERYSGGPPPGPPPRPQHHSDAGPSDSHLRPPPGRPASVNSSHSSHSSYSGAPSTHSGSQSTYSGHSGHSGSSHQNSYSQNLPPQWMPAQPNPHLNYPRGYFCKKCHNTGVKVRKGTTCKECYERFGVRTQPQYLPPGVMPVFPVAPRVVMPGDPSIGGALCGRCRGSGVVHDLFIFEDTCPVCRGVGRVF